MLHLLADLMGMTNPTPLGDNWVYDDTQEWRDSVERMVAAPPIDWNNDDDATLLGGHYIFNNDLWKRT